LEGNESVVEGTGPHKPTNNGPCKTEYGLRVFLVGFVDVCVHQLEFLLRFHIDELQEEAEEVSDGESVPQSKEEESSKGRGLAVVEELQSLEDISLRPIICVDIEGIDELSEIGASLVFVWFDVCYFVPEWFSFWRPSCKSNARYDASSFGQQPHSQIFHHTNFNDHKEDSISIEVGGVFQVFWLS